MNALATINTNTIDTTDSELRQRMNRAAIAGTKSAATRKAWDATWSMYTAWCEARGIDALQADAAQVLAFLMDHPAAYTTQQARLSHMRSIMRLEADTTGRADIAHNAALLKLLKLPKMEDAPGMYKAAKPARQQERKERRAGRALTAHEVYQQLDRTWNTPEATARNRAILALMLYAGLRRGEVVKLSWSDIDMQEGVIAIRGAKKRDANHVDYVPMREEVRKALAQWRAINPYSRIAVRIGQKGNVIDTPLTGEAIRLIMGDDAMPHDARRTLATRALEAGAPINSVQQLLRHASADTTLRYAKYVDAKALASVKIGY
ncbi:MAG: site-specific integrase [Chloroflexota bacterium]|nr:site-specific integrase [Chloroflexota bacterium]